MFNTGENIELHIILRDGNGKDRTRGGDKLRVRMFNTTQQAFVAGHVTDHDNGSYTATVPALWSGNQNISVFLAYTREAVRAIYYIRKKVLKRHTCRTKVRSKFNSMVATISLLTNLQNFH